MNPFASPPDDPALAGDKVVLVEMDQALTGRCQSQAIFYNL